MRNIGPCNSKQKWLHSVSSVGRAGVCLYVALAFLCVTLFPKRLSSGWQNDSISKANILELDLIGRKSPWLRCCAIPKPTSTEGEA